MWSCSHRSWKDLSCHCSSRDLAWLSPCACPGWHLALVDHCPTVLSAWHVSLRFSCSLFIPSSAIGIVQTFQDVWSLKMKNLGLCKRKQCRASRECTCSSGETSTTLSCAWDKFQIDHLWYHDIISLHLCAVLFFGGLAILCFVSARCRRM